MTRRRTRTRTGPSAQVLRATLVLGLGATSAACHDPAPGDVGPPARVVTLFGLQRYLAPPGQPSPRLLPGGIPVRGRYTRPAPESDRVTADVIPAFADGQPAAYVTTEFWFHVDAVWVQPMYVLTTGKNSAGEWEPLPGALPIFSVGADREPGQISAFYSPYWRIYYARVPPGTPSDRYTSATQILRDRLPLTPGPPSLCALAPGNVDITDYDRTSARPPPHPTLGPFGSGANEPARTPVGPVQRVQGWVDGVRYDVLAFGLDRFTWDEQSLTVDALPLFVPVLERPNGEFVVAGLPAIVGTRPLYGNRGKFAAPGNKPNFGSLWRVYQVVVPPTAGTILPLAQAASNTEPHPNAARILADAADLAAAGVRVHDPGLPSASEVALRPYYLRTALDASCLDRLPLDLDNCIWLDSQDRIETFIPPRKIIDTGILANCPFVTFAGEAVPN